MMMITMVMMMKKSIPTLTVLAAGILGMLTSGAQAARQNPTYEIVKSWPGAFDAKFCLTAPQDMFGWKIRIHFAQSVTAIRIRRAAVRTQNANSTLYHLGDRFWNARWLTGERNCFDFTGAVSGVDTGVVASRIEFAGIVEPTGCPPQIQGQQFTVNVTRHWSKGLGGEFCWILPLDFNGDWKIRVEFDQMLFRLVSLDADTFNIKNRLHWLMKPKQDGSGAGRQLINKGDNFCLEFTAFSRQMINPCIRAFFTEDDSLTPITDNPGSITTSMTPSIPDPPTPSTTSPSPSSTAMTTPRQTTSERTTQVPTTTTTPKGTRPSPSQPETSAPTAATTTTRGSNTGTASGWGGVYTEKSVWDAGVNGNLCLDYSIQPDCGWEMDIRFEPAINSLDIWTARSTGSSIEGTASIFHLVNMSWNKAITTNPFCQEFNGQKSYNDGPSVTGRFTRICSGGTWTDVSTGGGSGPATAPQTTPVDTGPVQTGRVNQDMIDLFFTPYEGDGTYYGEGQDGACAYDQGDFPNVGLSNEIDALAALNYIKWYNSKTCGMCFKVTGNGTGGGNDPLDGEYIVFIKDLCPQGACSLPGSVDFALDGDGRWKINMKAVQCPVGNNKLQYTFQGSNPWYLKLQVSNYRIPPNEVEIKRNGVWENMTKSLDGHWVFTDGTEMTNTNDIRVRVTAINGEQLTDTIPQLMNSQTMDGQQGVQFSFDPNLPSLSSSPHTAPTGHSPSSPPTPVTAPSTGTTSQSSGPVMTGNVNQDMLDLYKNTFDGDGTYYGEGQEGTCTYHQGEFPNVGLSNQIDALAALNHIKWYNSKACGMCFKVTGEGVGLGNDPLDGEYIVFIKDLCPSGACSKPGSVDFAQSKDGRWDIKIQAVQCPVGTNKLQYTFQGSNPWYIKLQVSNYRIPPNKVEIKRNGVWKTLTKSSDGYWLLTDGVEMTNKNDIPVRVTAINGEQLTDTIPQLVNSQTMDGQQGVQFSFDPNLPSLSSSPHTAPTGHSPSSPPAPVTAPSTGTTSQSNSPVMTGVTNQEMLDLYKSTFAGDGTYYGEGQEGTCTYHQGEFPNVGLSNQIDALAALNYIKWYNSKACGMCFKVTGEGVGLGNDPLDGEYIVFIKDLCPSGACSKSGSVDFAQNKDGRWDIEIQAVQCPVGTNKLQYTFQGSNPWYIKLQVSNYRIPPNKVELKRNGVWKTLTKSSDGYWLLSDGVEMTNKNDIPVRVTAINGEQLTDTIPQLDNDRTMNGGEDVQFSLDPNLPTV